MCHSFSRRIIYGPTKVKILGCYILNNFMENFFTRILLFQWYNSLIRTLIVGIVIFLVGRIPFKYLRYSRHLKIKFYLNWTQVVIISIFLPLLTHVFLGEEVITVFMEHWGGYLSFLCEVLLGLYSIYFIILLKYRKKFKKRVLKKVKKIIRNPTINIIILFPLIIITLFTIFRFLNLHLLGGRYTTLYKVVQ